LARVAALAQRRRLPANSLLWSRGECNDALVILVSGRMKALLSNEEGREMTLHVFTPYEYLGEMSIFDRSTHSANVHTVEACDVLWIPGEAFRELMREEPRMVWHLLQVQTERVRRLSDELASHAFMSTCRRVARKLLQCAGENPHAEISHQDLAGLIGSTRESVTRALADLERRGMIATGKQKIALRDRAGLTEMLDSI
ncbi:MAG: Crp/Fnr family transcriptional regulator, partial [Armatimonadetes bacterium]|nr:Crp/Fnr family transcriptional regulator [Armatimonadota bacterium]